MSPRWSFIAFFMLMGLAAAPRPANAGACAGPRPVGLSLVAPEGPISLSGGGGPLLTQVRGTGPRSNGRERRDLFSRLRLSGPGGPVTPSQRALAPGLHLVSSTRFRRGRYRVSGIQSGGSVTFTSDAPPSMPAPQITSAVRVVGEARPGPRGRSYPAPIHVTLTLDAAPPAAATWLLLYPPGVETDRQAISLSRVEATTTAVVFRQTHHGRCGPPLPLLGVPNAGNEIAAAWLSSTGHLSPISARITVR